MKQRLSNLEILWALDDLDLGRPTCRLPETQLDDDFGYASPTNYEHGEGPLRAPAASSPSRGLRSNGPRLSIPITSMNAF